MHLPPAQLTQLEALRIAEAQVVQWSAPFGDPSVGIVCRRRGRLLFRCRVHVVADRLDVRLHAHVRRLPSGFVRVDLSGPR